MENPEFITGIPVALLGILGVFIALTLFVVPAEATGVRTRVRQAHAGHPDPIQYVVIGLTLAFITAIEVGLYYIELNFNLMVMTLLFLSAIKFMLVVGFFMHLKFDHKVFSLLFFGGLLLAIAIFTVAIATLGGGLT